MRRRENTRTPRTLYAAVFFSYFSFGTYQPYIIVYAVEMGARYDELGIVTSVGNASPAIFQPL